MTRKDYELIAEVLSDSYDPNCHYKWIELVDLFCIKFSTNPKFNPSKFKEACKCYES